MTDSGKLSCVWESLSLSNSLAPHCEKERIALLGSLHRSRTPGGFGTEISTSTEINFQVAVAAAALWVLLAAAASQLAWPWCCCYGGSYLAQSMVYLCKGMKEPQIIASFSLGIMVSSSNLVDWIPTSGMILPTTTTTTTICQFPRKSYVIPSAVINQLCIPMSAA